MKLAKLSLAAIMAMGTSAFAIDNVKATGALKVIYQTTDANKATGAGLFEAGEAKTPGGAAGNVGVKVNLSADLASGLSGGFEGQGITTMGLENSLVSGVMATESTDDQYFVSQLWFAYTAGKTTAKIGMQELNTPLAFTEKWNVVSNTFEAFVLINSDIENVTLVGAYVGKGNGNAANAPHLPKGGGGQIINAEGDFHSYYDGAYAFGAITAVSGVNLQGWYYNVQDVADAVWLEADTKIEGIFVGAQYAMMDTKDNPLQPLKLGEGGKLSAFALKVGGDIGPVHAYAAYSSVDDDKGYTLGFSNTATLDKTKLYTGTASIYGDGALVAQEDTDAWKIGVKAKVADVTLAAAYLAVDYGPQATRKNGEATVLDFSAATKVGPLGLKAIYTQYEVENAVGTTTTENDTVRIIASVKF